jgi:hypothetical protein
MLPAHMHGQHEDHCTTNRLGLAAFWLLDVRIQPESEARRCNMAEDTLKQVITWSNQHHSPSNFRVGNQRGPRIYNYHCKQVELDLEALAFLFRHFSSE